MHSAISRIPWAGRLRGLLLPIYVGAAFAPILLAGCQPFQPTQVTSANGAPIASPQGQPTVDVEAERNKQCAAIRRKIAETKSYRDNAPQFMTGKGFIAGVQLDADRKIAALESEYADLQCEVIRVVPGKAVVPPTTGAAGSSMTFDECFKRCRELTSRTEEECFDACRR